MLGSFLLPQKMGKKGKIHLKIALKEWGSSPKMGPTVAPLVGPTLCTPIAVPVVHQFFEFQKLTANASGAQL